MASSVRGARTASDLLVARLDVSVLAIIVRLEHDCAVLALPGLPRARVAMIRAWAIAIVLLPTSKANAQPPSELQIASDPEDPTLVGKELASSDVEHEPRRHRGHFPQGWFLPVGLSVAGAAHPTSPTALAVGAEASVVAFPVAEGNWVGAYVDAVHELDNDLTRISIGPEVGFVLIGVDGGFVVQRSERGTHYGGAVRPMLSFSFLTVYGRWGWLSDDERFREIGVLLKLPIHLVDADFTSGG